MKELLEREAVTVPEIDAKARSLAERARDRLGYNGLMRQWERPLAQALRELDIQPFSPRSVEMYKNTRLEEATDALLKLQISHEEKVKRNNSLSVRSGWKPGQEVTREERNAIVTGTRYVWSMAPLKCYHGPVPEFVLSKALEIQDKVPEVGFAIDYLRYHFDPFLVAHFNDETYHVEVWDEPKFEERLLSRDPEATANSINSITARMADLERVYGIGGMIPARLL